MNKILCPYCFKEAEWVENKEVYGVNFGKSYMIYLCRPCNAYVGCHNNTTRPMGTLANKDLREMRSKAHNLIDPIWQKKKLSRSEVYQVLEYIFKRPFHIAMEREEALEELFKYSRSRIIELYERMYAESKDIQNDVFSD